MKHFPDEPGRQRAFSFGFPVVSKLNFSPRTRERVSGARKRLPRVSSLGLLPVKNILLYSNVILAGPKFTRRWPEYVSWKPYDYYVSFAGRLNYPEYRLRLAARRD